MLDATSIDELLRRATAHGQATGHNLQLFKTAATESEKSDPLVINVEVAPGGGGEAAAVIVGLRNLTGADSFYHTNQVR